MLNEVQIFETSVFNSELDSNFTNSKIDSGWQPGRKLYSKVMWSGASWCSSATGRWPVSDIVSSVLSRRYVDCAADYSVDVASQSCHTGPHIHAGVNIKQFYENTAASLKPLYRISSVQYVNFRGYIAAAKRELLSASEH